MSLSDLAATEAVLKALLDQVTDRLKTVRAEMQAGMDADGIRQVTAKLPDGTTVAKISSGGDPKLTATVVDPGAFLAWVRDHHPDPGAIVRRFVTEVRPATQTALLAEMTAAGVPQWCNQETGEVHTVPGVEIRPTRSSSHRVLFTPDGRDLVAEAWRTGQLTTTVMRQLTAGDEQ